MLKNKCIYIIELSVDGNLIHPITNSYVKMEHAEEIFKVDVNDLLDKHENFVSMLLFQFQVELLIPFNPKNYYVLTLFKDNNEQHSNNCSTIN